MRPYIYIMYTEKGTSSKLCMLKLNEWQMNVLNIGDLAMYKLNEDDAWQYITFVALANVVKVF